MKKVFLSLAVVAMISLVSCKDSETQVEETTIETTEEVMAEPEVMAPVATDTMAVETTTTTEVETK